MRVKEFVWPDTVIGNIETALRSHHHSMKGEYARRNRSKSVAWPGRRITRAPIPAVSPSNTTIPPSGAAGSGRVRSRGRFLPADCRRRKTRTILVANLLAGT